MKHGDLFKGADYPAGRCVACGGPLGHNRTPNKEGAPRKVCCGSRECYRTYFILRRSRIAELVALGLEAEERGRA